MSDEDLNESLEIRIIGVNKSGIKVSNDKKGFWDIPFQLSPQPEESWNRKFYEVQQKSAEIMKRKIHVINDYLAVEVSETDDLQKILDALKIVVAETNAQCVSDYQKKLRIRQELEVLHKKQTDATQKFKEDSDKLEF